MTLKGYQEASWYRFLKPDLTDPHRIGGLIRMAVQLNENNRRYEQL